MLHKKLRERERESSQLNYKNLQSKRINSIYIHIQKIHIFYKFTIKSGFT